VFLTNHLFLFEIPSLEPATATWSVLQSTMGAQSLQW